MNKPRIDRMVPVFGITSHQEAVSHYVDWLGFNLDWEWREAPGLPVIMAISRDNVAFMLNEHRDSPAAADVRLQVNNLEELADEWNEKRPGSAVVRIELPYEFPELSIADPWGNRLTFHEDNSAEQERLRAENAPKMRDYIQKKLDDGMALPTPEEVRAAVGPVLGFAFEVLNEFPEHGEAHRARKMASD